MADPLVSDWGGGEGAFLGGEAEEEVADDVLAERAEGAGDEDVAFGGRVGVEVGGGVGVFGAVAKDFG